MEMPYQLKYVDRRKVFFCHSSSKTLAFLLFDFPYTKKPQANKNLVQFVM